MGRILLLAVAGTLGWVLLNDRARREAMEVARDLSDSLMLLALRSTSGFARDVSPSILREERERRLRWR